LNPEVTLNILLAGLVSRAGGLLEELRGVTDMKHHPVEEQPTPAALLHRIRDIWDLLDQDNPEIDKPLSAADFIEEIGPIMRAVRPE
jgi:hypothetical protein